MSRQYLWLYLGLLQGPYFDNTGGSPGALRYSSLKSYSLPQVLYSLILTLRITLCFNSTLTKNLQMFKLDLEKAEEPEVKLLTSIESLKKQESSGKTSTSALLATLKPLTVWITTNCGKFFKRWGIPDHLTCLLRNLYCRSRSSRTGHGTTNWFQTGKGVCQGYILSPC